MDLYYLDHISVSGRSWLHRMPAGWKLLALVAIIALVLAMPNVAVFAAVLLTMLLLAVGVRLPLKTMLALTLYPLIFLVIIFLSVRGLTASGVLFLTLRVLAITSSVILLLLTTSYPAIFGALGRVLPGFLVTALFFTYRSLFILSTGFNNVHTALHLRGALSWKRPFTSLRNLGMALGHFMAHAIETSQRMADSLTVRGFKNRIYYIGERHG